MAVNVYLINITDQFLLHYISITTCDDLAALHLAALHFNHNRRENMLDQNGQHRLRVTYMKYKESEGTVRHLREKQDFSMLLMSIIVIYLVDYDDYLLKIPIWQLKN